MSGNLPYENATSGKGAVDDMHKVVRGFGATSFGVMENFAEGELIVQFEFHGRRVSINANAKGYAAAWLRRHPFNPRYHRVTKVEYERRALTIAQTAVYSIVRDWIKGQVTAVEIGLLSFEGAFLGQILLPSGETVLERATATKLLEIAP